LSAPRQEENTIMAMQTPIVAGVFTDATAARRALDALRQGGFDQDQIGLAMHNRGNVNLRSDLLGLGVPKDFASYYDQEYQAGRTVVSVRPDGREREALDILRNYGAYDYEQRTATNRTTTTRETQTSAQDVTTGRTRAQDVTARQGVSRDAVDETDAYYQPRSLRLREEQLNVNKERVQAGEARLRKEVVAEQKTIDVPVTHEEIIIEQRPITGGRVDTTPIGESETIRVPVSEERVNVSKQTVETGEVTIDKRAVQETQRVTDTVRKEKARVEQEGDAPIHNTESDRLHPNQKRNKENR